MNQLIKEVREKLKNVAHDSYIRSTCPSCFGMPAISGNHRCGEGWERVKDYSVDEIVKIMKENYEFFQKLERPKTL